MNSVQISTILKQVLPKQFGGVFPADCLPSKSEIQEKPKAFVANTHKHNLPGEHWVCFYFPVQGPNEYFDSYGLAPWIQEFKVFLGNSYMRSSKTLQSLNSDVCGQYCIFFLLMRIRKCSLQNILNMFSTNRVENDNIVKTFCDSLQVNYRAAQNKTCQCCKRHLIVKNAIEI